MKKEKLQPVLYNGKKTAFRVDSKGREYLYFSDPKNRIIIRQVIEEDLETLLSMNKQITEAKEKQRILNQIRNLPEYSPNIPVIFETKSHKVLAYAEIIALVQVTAFAKIQIWYKDVKTMVEREKDILSTVKNLCEKHRIYDLVGLEQNGNVKKIIYVSPFLKEKE